MPIFGRRSTAATEAAKEDASSLRRSLTLRSLFQKMKLSGSEAKLKAAVFMAEAQAEDYAAARALHERACDAGAFISGQGPISDFYKGLSGFLGPPKSLILDAMEKEHCQSEDSDIIFTAAHSGISSTSKIEWYFVTDPVHGLEKLGLDDWPAETTERFQNHKREPRLLEEFEDVVEDINQRLEAIGIPGLTTDELIACRLYTGPLGVKYNSMVRAYTAVHQTWRKNYLEEFCKDNRYSTTIHVLQSAVSKLGKICPVETIYYGISDAALPERYWTKEENYLVQGGVEGSFTSGTTSFDVALEYACSGKLIVPSSDGGLARDGGHYGIVFEINMPIIDRGADLSWLSQYPHEEEILLPPLTFHMVDSISLAPKTESVIVFKTTCRLCDDKLMRPLLSIEESKMLKSTLADSDASLGETRFSAANAYFITGNPMEAVLGLPHYLKVDNKTLLDSQSHGVAAIEAEVRDYGNEELEECLHYVLYEEISEKEFPNGIRDQGRTETSIEDFVNHPIAKRCNLDREHVVALRLYTTAAFKYINGPLRDLNSSEPHPLPVTVAFIAEGIRRLRAEFEVSGSAEDKFLWRGVKNTLIANDFVENKMGGTELGLMSTSTNLEVAASYGSSEQGLLLKISLSNLVQYGASVNWLSAFPHEEEVLYPPLTYLQPTGAVDTLKLNNIQLTIIEVKPYVA